MFTIRATNNEIIWRRLQQPNEDTGVLWSEMLNTYHFQLARLMPLRARNSVFLKHFQARYRERNLPNLRLATVVTFFKITRFRSCIVHAISAMRVKVPSLTTARIYGILRYLNTNSRALCSEARASSLIAIAIFTSTRKFE